MSYLTTLPPILSILFWYLLLKKNIRKYLTLVDILHFWHCHANAIKNHTFASLTSGPEHLLKYVTYVTWHNE